jgi:hypothetical protein
MLTVSRRFPSGEGIQVNITFSGHGKSFNCSCAARRPKFHGTECQCTCWYCERQRSCPCNIWHGCSCPALCNCCCKHCHPQTYDTSKAKKKKTPIQPKDSSDSQPCEPRICAEEGCERKVRVKNVEETRCSQCRPRPKSELRKCIVPECDRIISRGSSYGRVCANCSEDPELADNSPGCKRECAIEGCTKPAPEGSVYNLCCSSACQRARKAENKKRKREADDVGEAGPDETQATV